MLAQSYYNSCDQSFPSPSYLPTHSVGPTASVHSATDLKSNVCPKGNMNFSTLTISRNIVGPLTKHPQSILVLPDYKTLVVVEASFKNLKKLFKVDQCNSGRQSCNW